jgi:hypothetical protein
VNSSMPSAFIDWDWLRAQKAEEEMKFTRHLRFDEEIIVRINGHKSQGVVFKPGKI